MQPRSFLAQVYYSKVEPLVHGDFFYASPYRKPLIFCGALRPKRIKLHLTHNIANEFGKGCFVHIVQAEKVNNINRHS